MFLKMKVSGRGKKKKQHMQIEHCRKAKCGLEPKFGEWIGNWYRDVDSFPYEGGKQRMCRNQLMLMESVTTWLQSL